MRLGVDTVEKNTETKGKRTDGKVAAEDLLTTYGGGSKTRPFISPGKDVLELLMRTNFRDDDQAVAAVLLYDKCLRYDLELGLEDLKAYLAAKCSVQGRSTLLALMASTGVIAPGMLSKGNDMRTFTRKERQRDDHQKPAEPD